MKLLVLTICCCLAVVGAFNEQFKYVYHYEAWLNPAKLPYFEGHIAKLHFNGTLELKFYKNNIAKLQIKDINIYECLSDPKNMSGVNERLSEFSNRVSRPMLRKPVKFVYSNGLVQQVFAEADDPDWSVNMKKGIINMVQVDVQGKDSETGLKDFFTKEEKTIFGKCKTSYTKKAFEIVNAREIRRKIGLNITKTIDLERCVDAEDEFFNKVVQGRSTDKDSNPLKTTATIKFNITGSENKFKIEGVTAKGVYVLFPFSKQEEGIPTESVQRLVLLTEGPSDNTEEDNWEPVYKRGKLMMKLPSFHKPEVVPPMTQQDRENKAVFIRKTIKRFLALVPRGAPVQSVVLVPEISTVFMQIVHNIRQCDMQTLSTVWQKCNEETVRHWLVQSLSLCHTEMCMELMRAKLTSLKDDEIFNYLQGINFLGQPTRFIVNKMQTFCGSDRMYKNPKLSQACWISASNIVKGFCSNNPACSSWVESLIIQALQKISKPACYKNIEKCQPIKNLQVHTVMSIAENLGRPSFLAPLEQIIFHPEVPTNVKVHAVSCCRPIIRQSPRRVQIVMTRLFRDFKYDSQLRSLALLIIMENPHPHLIQLCARQIYVEPSLNIRKFAHELFQQCSESVIKYGKTIRYTCKLVLKLYTKLYLPTSMSSYRSRYLNGQYQNMKWNFASEMEGCWIANNNSYVPRFSEARLMTSILGRDFEVFDSKIYMQGIDGYINWMMKKIRQLMHGETEANGDVHEKIKDINKKTFFVPKEQENLVYEGRLTMFDRLVNVRSLILKKDESFTDHFHIHVKTLMKALKKLKDGQTFTWTQPFMPVEAMYIIPSMVGVPLVYNMTSFAMPYSRSKIELELEPDISSPLNLLRNKKLQEIELSGTQQLSALAEVRGTIKYQLPFIEVGAECRQVLNMSVHIQGEFEYNFQTKETEQEIKMPMDKREVMYSNAEAFHYIKTSKEPLRKVQVEVDELDKVQIINVTKPCEGHCRAEEWMIKATTGKYLSVQEGRVVLKSEPFKFKVLFHGVNRRIISLYVPNQGYVVMSRKQPCLFVTKSGAGKYFIVDFENLQNTLIKSLVHMEKVPESWGMPSNDELRELKEVNSLLMREQVTLSGEEYIERELIDQSKQFVRIGYLALTRAPRVCLTPRRSQALNFTAIRERTLTNLLTRYSYDNRTCIGKPWGFNLCLHGFHPTSIERSPVSMLITPSMVRLTCSPDEDNKVRKIKLSMNVVKDSEKEKSYYTLVTLKGTDELITIKTVWYKKDKRLSIKVTPSDPMLLRMKKLCYDEHFKPDNYSLRISVDDKECKKVHVLADFLAPKKLPRHQMAFRYNFTTEGMPSFWRQSIWYMDTFIVRPLLRYSSDYWYANTTAYRNLTKWNYDATINGTVHLQYLLTSNDTITYKIVAPTETWVWEKVKLNAFINTFPKGTKKFPLVHKLNWLKKRAFCRHFNSTFTTFDKNVYEYKLRRNCDQILLRSCYSNMSQIIVTTRRMSTANSSSRRILTSLVGDHEITFIPREGYDDEPLVKVDGKLIHLDRQGRYEKRVDGRMLFFVTWETELKMLLLGQPSVGLYVVLQRGYMVAITLDRNMVGKVCGMCGDYNGEQRFGFRTPDGELIRDVQKPKLYDPELRLYEERHFGNSWFVPSANCTRGECSFKREFVNVQQQNQYCLTRFRVAQCMNKCSPVAFEQLKTPTVCVAKNESSLLESHLACGQPVTLVTATDHLVPVKLPIKCNCSCGSRNAQYW